MLGSPAMAAAEAVRQLCSVPASSGIAQFRLHAPLGEIPDAVLLPPHWAQDLRQRGRALERLAWTECMAATET
eukprot:1695142-Pyramimonas_sp.AAC.1